MHLTGYALHLLTLILIILYPFLLLLAAKYPTLLTPIGVGLIMNLLAFAPAAYYATAQQLLRRRWIGKFPLIFLISIFSSGMILNTLRACIQILQKRIVPFERTPKYGITLRAQSWFDSRYQIKIDSLVFFELLLGAINLLTSWFAWKLGYYFFMTFAFFFASSLFFTSGLTIQQAISARFSHNPKPASD